MSVPADRKVIRIAIIDDHSVVRSGLRMLIESEPNMSVVAEAGNEQDAIAMIEREQPDLILLDLDIDGRSSLDFLPELLTRSGQSRVLLLTGLDDLELHRRALHLGAMGVVLKEQAASVLIKAIEKVHEGEVWIDRAMMASVLTDLSKAREGSKADTDAARISSLTEREVEVISFICDGLQNKRIADRMGITETTVRHHLTSIFAKLGCESRLELVIYAYKHGLATPSK
jgi:two-component system, NarL family, nitrate/nitrite response regulator NarL